MPGTEFHSQEHVGGRQRGSPKPEPAPKAPAPAPKRYTLVSKEFPKRDAAPGDGPHRGTGSFKFKKALVEPWTVGRDRSLPLTMELGIGHPAVSIRVMSFEIATSEAPNWFGVSFRKEITAFDSVMIFCHPNPQRAAMLDPDYPARGGRWPALFRYAEMFGTQLAAADSNLVAIVPFFSNASYMSTGLFGPSWQSIVSDILTAVRQDAAAGNAKLPAASLKNVVLAGFSFGRQLAINVRNNARGLGAYLREIWDFDGKNAPTPAPTKTVSVIRYDQENAVSDQFSNFHVPPKLWRKFHGDLVDKPGANVHSNIPDMLGWHAAAATKFGRP